MSSQNRSLPSSSMSSNRVRQLWPSFEKSLSKSRATLEHRVKAAVAKVDADYNRIAPNKRTGPVQHLAIKAKTEKDIRAPYFEDVRSQWQAKLDSVGLRMEDWTDMSEEEMLAVSNVLGDFEDESDEEIEVLSEAPLPVPPPSLYTTTFLQAQAPSLSTSTRSTNVSSASSYAFVNPSEFNSEDEDHFFMPVVATSHDLTSDDDDSAGIPIRRRQTAFDGWSSDSLGSSLQNSVDSSSEYPFPRPLASGFSHNSSHGRMTSAKQQAAQSDSARASVPKAKIPRQPYVGPSVDDPDEPLGDEEDFERFKMKIRIQKIVEFHQAAALADIELAVAIYKDRKSLESDKQEVSSRVVNHQRRMSQLQMEKEEERKNIVKTERSKRRSELRQRPGRSNTLIAPIPSVPTNPSWLNSFQEEATGDLESNFDLQKILADDANERDGNVEAFLEKMFPASSFSSPNGSSFQHDYALPTPTGRGVPSSTSSHAAFASASQASKSPFSRRRSSDALSNKKADMKSSRKVKPSLFGDDESSDEEDSSPSPPAEAINPYLDPSAGAFLSSQLLAQPEIAAAFAQWGGSSDADGVPPVPSWGTRPPTQTPGAPSPWASKEARSTPVSSGWNRRKPSISTPQPQAPSQFSNKLNNPFGLTESSETPLSLSALAAFNSAQAKAKASTANIFGEPEGVQPDPPKKTSPPLPVPPPTSNKSLAYTPAAPTPAALVKDEKPAPTPPASASKKLNKKQRLAMKKGGAGAGANADEPEAEPEPAPTKPAPPPARSSTPTTPSEQVGSSIHASESGWSIPGMSRLRKDSNAQSPFCAWDDISSTPRAAPKIPSHLQEGMSMKPGGTPRPGLFGKNPIAEMLGSGSQTSTIKAPQWGSAATGAASRSAWSIFGSDPAPSNVQEPAAASKPANRDPWVPGSFDVDDGGGDGGGGGEEQVEEEEEQQEPATQKFWTPPARSLLVDKSPAPTQQQQPMSVAQQRLRRVSQSSGTPAANARVSTPIAQPQVAPTPLNSKKGKGKKNGKGKKVTVEDVPDEEPDSRGESLPTDSRFIMEPQAIVEPRPSVPPTMFESIISYDDEDDEDERTSSSFAPTPSTAPSSPPDPFDGDEARKAAAIKELQDGTSRMEKVIGGGAWNAGKAKQHVPWTPSASDGETLSSSMFSAFGRASAKPTSATPIWGQLSATKDKGKGKMTDLGGANEVPKVAPNPAIQNLKRSKATAGGKLF